MGLETHRADLARNTLGVLFIGGLALASFWILRPFLAAFIWAVMIVVATWPLMRRVQSLLWQRRGLAVIVMTLAMLLVVVMPLVLAIATVASYADDVAHWATTLTTRQLGEAPAWLAGLPLVGERAAAAWNQFAGDGFSELALLLEPYIRDIARWFVGGAGTVGLLFAQGLLIVILSALLYAGGEGWGRWMLAFGRRLAEARGEQAIVLAGQAIRGVALGVIVTAILQSALGGIGLALAGVPFAGALTAVMFMLCVAQLGPILILGGGTAWLFISGSTGWGSFLLVWTLVVGLMDNFVRPVLIKRGADLPLLLIFAGVIGGMLSFGLIGIFVGPVVLAVTYTLVDAWVQEAPRVSA
ncbi:MAG: AI-2E family transporter YdiK [Gammaproteobacteria bacterium]|nr:AI-2E family transporter YdiK [Gammaproteobacteria bacterium]